MHETTRRTLAVCVTAALVVAMAPVVPAADGETARLEGVVIGLDGRPAEGHRVVLVGPTGNELGTAETGERGIYRFRDLAAGDYGLGVVSPDGTVAPVDAPPARVGDGELVRRDVKLMESPGGVHLAPAVSQGGVGEWWAGLSKGAKAGSVIALVVITGIIILAVTDDKEESASPIQPD